MPIDPLQADVGRIALSAAGHDFALAGGNALVAHGLLSRPTTDVDLFSPEPAGAAQVANAVQAALTDAGYQVELIAGLGQGGDDFARFQVTAKDRTVLLDLARDWRANPAVTLAIGPVLDLEDAVASKVAALVGRGLPRDFIDVAAVLSRFDRSTLMRLAFTRDPGLRLVDFALAAQQLDRLPDGEFVAYGMTETEIEELRARFTHWPRSADDDQLGREAYGSVHRSDGSNGEPT